MIHDSCCGLGRLVDPYIERRTYTNLSDSVVISVGAIEFIVHILADACPDILFVGYTPSRMPSAIESNSSFIWFYNVR